MPRRKEEADEGRFDIFNLTIFNTFRMRKYKEKFATTEIQKLQNRAAFGVAEEEILVGDEFEGLGLAGKSAASGKVRASATDTRTKGTPKFSFFSL